MREEQQRPPATNRRTSCSCDNEVRDREAGNTITMPSRCQQAAKPKSSSITMCALLPCHQRMNIDNLRHDLRPCPAALISMICNFRHVLVHQLQVHQVEASKLPSKMSEERSWLPSSPRRKAARATCTSLAPGWAHNQMERQRVPYSWRSWRGRG